MSGLVEFLLARYDEGEGHANAWQAALDDGVIVSAAAIKHHGVVNPARVLADLAAKRAIVALHPQIGRMRCECSTPADNDTSRPWLCVVLRLLAQPYADHADFRPEWAPSPRLGVATAAEPGTEGSGG